MIQKLLRFTAVLSFLAAAPAAHSQYIYLDTDGDAACGCGDFLLSGSSSADVWIDTAANKDGSPAACSGTGNLSLDAYVIVVRGFSVSSIDFTNKVAGFDVQTHSAHQTTDWVFGYSPSSTGSSLTQGKHLLGTLLVNSPAGATVALVSSTATDPEAFTGFHSECSGKMNDHWIKLGDDFLDACAAGNNCDALESTTWGRIKAQYR